MVCIIILAKEEICSLTNIGEIYWISSGAKVVVDGLSPSEGGGGRTPFPKVRELGRRWIDLVEILHTSAIVRYHFPYCRELPSLYNPNSISASSIAA